jgi:hypothetical protein
VFARILVLMFTIAAYGCSRETDIDASLALYNQGDTRGAIELLDGEPKDHYEVSNLLALYHISAAYRGSDNSEFKSADALLSSIKIPEKNRELLTRHVTFLRFLSASNSGRATDAKRTFQPYCGRFEKSLEHFDCLRVNYFTALMLIQGAYPPGTKMHNDFIDMARAGFKEAYGWDPAVFRSSAEREGFLARASAQTTAMGPSP